VAPPQLTRELRKVHQFNTFSIVSPLQYAIAGYLSAYPDAWAGLSAFFQAKRDLFAGLLRGSGFEPIPAAGTYFQLVDYGALSGDNDMDFADRLIREAKIATIPLSPFYAAPPAMTLLRLCIAKSDSTLEAAAERLCAFAATHPEKR
jgi:methionine aminotransferase